MTLINTLPILTNPLATDYDITIDSQDSNKTKRTSIASKVKVGVSDPSVTADDMNEWTTNKFMTATERTKLTNIEANAQVNLLERVNGQTWSWPSKNLVLTLDDIPDWVSRKAWDVAYDTGEQSKVNTAYSHSQSTGNPHWTTASQIWLWLVANERQLSRTAGNFSALPVKSDIQRELNDIVPIQDSIDNDIIKSVTVGTQYIWYASHIQLWRPSINYNADTLVSSTTYEIRSIVVNQWDWNMYYCNISHQSSSSFAADLANWYWTLIGAGGGWSSPVYVVWDTVDPFQTIPWWPRTPSGAFVWQLFANTVTGNIWVWDGNDWIVNLATWGWGWSGIVYSLSNWSIVVSTTGDRGLASTGTGADKTYETSQTINPATWNTINQTYEWGTVTYTNETIVYTAPVQISCEWSVSFGTPYTTVANTDFVRVEITNWWNTYTIDQPLNIWSVTYAVWSGVISIDTTSLDVTVSDISWANTLDSICYYEWNVVYNNWTVQYNNGGTIINNNTNTYGGTYTGILLEDVTINNSWLVQSVTGNIVDNTDPSNPVVTQVQPDWSATSWLSQILNKSVKPTEIAGTTTNGKIVVRDTNSSFRDATASDITALWFTPSLGWETIYISAPFTPVLTINTITHNLGLTQADVEAWMYTVWFSYKRTTPSTYWVFSRDPIGNIENQSMTWSASNPSWSVQITNQANALKFETTSIIWNTYRVHIVKNF